MKPFQAKNWVSVKWALSSEKLESGRSLIHEFLSSSPTMDFFKTYLSLENLTDNF